MMRYFVGQKCFAIPKWRPNGELGSGSGGFSPTSTAFQREGLTSISLSASM